MAIIQAYANTNSYQLDPVIPTPGPSPVDNMNNINGFFNGNDAKITQVLNSVYVQRETKKYEARFQFDSAYVFSDNDFQKIQKLINEMRDIITSSDVISPKHKQRLLERLERLQKELHKSTSDLDRFWGFVGEAGIVIGKFGADIKPLVDRISELASIVWRVVAAKEMLLDKPNPIMLPNPNYSSDDSVAT